MVKKSVAIIGTGAFSRAALQALHKDRHFILFLLMGSFSADMFHYAKNRVPLDNGFENKDILAKLVENGLIPSMKEAEGDDEEAERPSAHEKTIDIVVLDMGLDINFSVITALKNHVNTAIIVRASNTEERRQLKELGQDIVRAVCPDREAGDNILSVIMDNVVNMRDALGEWDSAEMPIPSAWIGREVAPIEAELGIVISLIQEEIEVEKKKNKPKETIRQTFPPEKNYIISKKDVCVFILGPSREKLVNIERDI